MAPRPVSLKVEVPKAGQDRPQFGRVAIITVVGFVVGVLWPRLAGVNLVPSAPIEEIGGRAADEAPAGSAPKPPQAAKVAPAPAPKKEDVDPAVEDRVKLGEPVITSCRDGEGKRMIHCGDLDLTKVVVPRLTALAGCPAAEGALGKLSVGLELDFGKRRVTSIEKGKSTTLGNTAADSILECAKKEFETASLSGVENRYASYTVFYVVDFVPPGQKEEKEEQASVNDASGTATVAWEVALMRKSPKDGDVVARVLRGTRVVVTGKQDDWYRVKYDAKGSEGWVYKSAIGL